MTIEEAVTAIHSEFPETKSDGPRAFISSGGPKVAGADPEPALYLTRELAIAAWLREMLLKLRGNEAVGVFFADGPHVDKWEMTATDSIRRHLVAEARYAVTASIVVVHRKEAGAVNGRAGA